MLFDTRSVSIKSGHMIDGEIVCGNDPDTIAVKSASDPSLAWQLPVAGSDMVDRAVRSAQKAFKSSGWPTMEPRARAKIMKRWAALVRENVRDLAQLESIVSTRPYSETMARDAHVAADCLSFFAEFSDKIDGEVTSTRSEILSLSIREPHGVVAAISPWNFPLILSAWKYAPALAAGNAVVMKPSELTPFSNLKIAELGIEAGLPPGIFNIVQGDGTRTGSALISHPDVDYVTFTGSTETGINIAETSARNGLKPHSLELGGKGAQVVFADAPDLDRLTGLLTRGVCYNSGQVCFAGSRLIVEKSVVGEIMSRIMSAMSELVPGATWDDQATLPPIMNPKQLERIETIISSAVGNGAEIICGGARVECPNEAVYFAPTILSGVDSNSAAVKQEIFGPVATIQTFDNVEEAIHLADHPEYALASSVHTSNLNTAINVSKRLEAGTIWVNDWGRKGDLTSPFGGFKRSGHGKDLGKAGFEKYQKSKSIWIETA